MDPCFDVFLVISAPLRVTQRENKLSFLWTYVKIQTYDSTDNLDVLHGLNTSDNIYIVISLYMNAIFLLY